MPRQLSDQGVGGVEKGRSLGIQGKGVGQESRKLTHLLDGGAPTHAEGPRRGAVVVVLRGLPWAVLLAATRDDAPTLVVACPPGRGGGIETDWG